MAATFKASCSPNLPADITWTESSFVNSRGRKIYTQQYTRNDPKAIIVFIHGYADHSHWLVKHSAERMAQRGLASFSFDQEGHGLSEGLPAYVPNFDMLADDSIHYIEYARNMFPGKKCFLYGGSMGGAIVLLVSLKRPELVDGIILSAPMLKVADSAQPHPLLVEALKGMAYFFPTWAVIPQVDIADLAFREQKDRDMARAHPLFYNGKVRLGTGLAILNITKYLQENLQNITHPMLILHGTGDLVTAPETSEELFDKARSTDKTIKLYEGLWHVLPLEPTAGNINQDVYDWITLRITGAQTCSNKQHIPFHKPAAEPVVNSNIPSELGGPSEKKSKSESESKSEEDAETRGHPAHEIITREGDVDAQVSMQTSVVVPAAN